MNEHSNISTSSQQPSPAALNTDAALEGKDILPQTMGIQCSLTVGAPDDPLEHEADAMADTVMRMPLTPLSHGNEAIQRKCAACEEEEKAQRKTLSASITPFIQTKSNGEGTTSASLSNRINSSRGSGTSLDTGTRTFMESRFGSDFSSVKIHTGSESVMMNRELNAKAFTVGSDIYFNEGQYNPQSDSGKHLLAHELTHTIQQGVAPVIRRALAAIDINAIADEVHAAVVGLGTDEERIFVSLQRLNRDPVDIAAVQAAYLARHGISLEAQLRDEMSGSELRFALELIGINDNPAAGNMINAVPVTAAQFTSAAQRLRNAIEGLGTDEETIYAVLLPFNRNAVALSRLKAAYQTLTGRDLQTDIEDDMSAEELHYALYLLNGDPDHTSTNTNATVNNAGTNLTTANVTGGTITANADVNYTNMGTGAVRPSGFFIGYRGGLATDTRWLQFIWREIIVTRTDGTTVAMNDLLNTSAHNNYHLTTNPSAPNYNTDSASATNPFYESQFLSNRTADATTIFDFPASMNHIVTREFGRAVNPATGVVSRAHFNTFLVRDYRPLYQVGITVEWTFTSAADPPRVNSLTTSASVTSLPEAMRNVLVNQYPDYSYIQ